MHTVSGSYVTHLKRFVTAGTVISLSAEYGVRGQTRFVLANATSTVSMTKRIYLDPSEKD